MKPKIAIVIEGLKKKRSMRFVGNIRSVKVFISLADKFLKGAKRALVKWKGFTLFLMN